MKILVSLILHFFFISESYSDHCDIGEEKSLAIGLDTKNYEEIGLSTYCQVFRQCLLDYSTNRLLDQANISGTVPPGLDVDESYQYLKSVGLPVNDLQKLRDGEEQFSKLPETCSVEAKRFGDICTEFSDVESHAIKFYTAFGYQPINKALRGDFESPSCTGIGKVLATAINRIPRYQGWTVRGTTLPDSIRETYIEGAFVYDRAFLSSSINNGWDGDDHFLIYSLNGRNLDLMHRKKSEEGEILFNNNTEFKVLKKFHFGSKNYYVLMEVDQDEELLESESRGEALLNSVKDELEGLENLVKLKRHNGQQLPDNHFHLIFSGDTDKLWKCSTSGSKTYEEIYRSGINF